MSLDEVGRALAAGNTVIPPGNVRIGNLGPMVPINSVVGDFKGLSNIPVRSQGTQTIFIRDPAMGDPAEASREVTWADLSKFF
jgi:hypothetical protein